MELLAVVDFKWRWRKVIKDSEKVPEVKCCWKRVIYRYFILFISFPKIFGM